MVVVAGRSHTLVVTKGYWKIGKGNFLLVTGPGEKINELEVMRT